MQSMTDSRIKYIKHEVNKNGAAARNTGIDNSSGEYIAFLDDDDTFLPTKISKQVDFLEKEKQFDAVYCQGFRNGKVIATNLRTGNLSSDILLLKSFMFTPSLMFRRSALEELNGFDISFIRHQDYELLLRYFKNGFKIGVIQEVLFEIGANKGENSPDGKKMERLKKYFFDKFDEYISELDRTECGFKSKVYAYHYSQVFLKYIKGKELKNALRIFNKYFWKSPLDFAKPIINSFWSHVLHI